MDCKELLRQRIKEMTALIGVSGSEWEISKYCYQALEGHVDSLRVLPNGVVIACKRGRLPGPRVLVTAHMDEVGYMVKSVDAKGFLYFDRLGGATEGCLPGRRVLVKGSKGVVPGVVGVRAGHLLTAEQMAKPQTVGQSYVDICVNSKEEAQALGIDIGAQIVPDAPYKEMQDPDYVTSRAVDCRVMCSVLIEIMKNLNAEEIHGEVYGVFNILEETTVTSIAGAVLAVQPHYGLFLDTTPCGDVPDCNFDKELPVALKKGPVLFLSQQFASVFLCAGSHLKLIQAVRNAAAVSGAKHQEFAFNGAGIATDAVGGVRFGLAVATLAVPRRFSHSPAELFHMQDVVDAYKIVDAFLKAEVDLTLD